MELVNLVIIIIMITVCLVWAIRKRREIETTTINFSSSDNAFRQNENERDILQDQQDLNFTANLLQNTIEAMLQKMHFICLILFAVMSVVVWVCFLIFTFSTF